MTLDRKDVFQASKILIDFLRDFTFLSEQQLLATKKMMESIVSQVMDSMMKLNEEAAHKKVQANGVLVKDSVSGYFIASNANTVATQEAVDLEGQTQEARKAILEARLLRNSGVFSNHLEAIYQLDKDLQSVMAQVVGSVSVDDLIAQRLGHVIRSMQSLKSGLSSFLQDYKTECTPARVKLLRNKILTEVYLSYTSEDEKEIFHKIFGHPRQSTKQAS